MKCEYVDQYAIGDPDRPADGCCGRFGELLYGTLIANVIPPSRLVNAKGAPMQLSMLLLGATGHYERWAAWSHIVGAVGFAAYAVVRQVLDADRGSVQGVLASVAAWTTTFMFLASSLYHATAPDPDFAAWTRAVDYIAIYAGIAVGATADIAAATRGFANVPLITIVDMPLAALLMTAFFVWRRAALPKATTWTDDYSMVPNKIPCNVGRGLFSRGHIDLHHSQLREATSLLLAGAYFLNVPAAVATLGGRTAAVVIALQAVGFVLAVLGMLLDRVLEWPNAKLISGDHGGCYPNACGCILSAHGVWHLIALGSAAATVVAREVALAHA